MEPPMKLFSLRHLVCVLATTAGLVAATIDPASVGLMLG
jgi:hypothetical protein